LRQLLIERLMNGYGRPPEVAANLVDHHLVLPVLDGLDEMDPLQYGGVPDPQAPRARAALARLSTYQDAAAPAQLILTCRASHYNALADADTLVDAAHVTITPVDAPDAVAYLASRTRTPARWRPLLDHLAANPTSPQATLLSTPWRLRLVATVYARTGDPTELLAHTTAHSLDQHLLAQYIPAVAAIANAAGTNARQYTPGQIHQWLHNLAAQLAVDTTASARSDIVLHRLWPMAGRTRVRITDVFLTVIACCTPILLAMFWATTSRASPALVAAGLILSVGLRAATTPPEPMRVDLRRLSSALRLTDFLLSMAAYVAIGSMVGVFAKVMKETPTSPLIGWALCGGVLGLLLTIPSGLVSAPSSAAMPRAVIRQDAQFSLFSGAMACIVCGLTLSVILGPAYAITGGLTAGLIAGLVAYQGGGGRRRRGGTPLRGAGAARRYTVFLLCARGSVPFRLANFLDWGCEAGLMRYSGTAYQFRHRELQLWLSDHPEPTPSPIP
ncbi:hypothetical protein, partial [Streptomyces fagopyri]|uniref:hypothetical protein n=1 Tax=Streptomyces fagopyri TaxID=2662397 RepID=UPI0033D5962B